MYSNILFSVRAIREEPLCYRKFIHVQKIKKQYILRVLSLNLNKVSSNEAIKLIAQLRESIKISAKANEDYAIQYATIPLVGRTIFEQQKLLYNSLLEWLNNFEAQMSKE